jgi:hypothetical protein
MGPLGPIPMGEAVQEEHLVWNLLNPHLKVAVSIFHPHTGMPHSVSALPDFLKTV